MAHSNMQVLFTVLFVVLMATMATATPPGIANNPSHARCLTKKYKHCYNLEHVCPKFCPDSCTVECVSCKPICSGGSTPPTTPSPTPSPTPPTPTPSPPPPTIPTPPTPTPSPPKYYPPPPTPTPPTPTPTPSPPTPTPPTPTPSPPTPSPPPPTPTPQTPTPSPPTPTPTPTPSPPTPTPTPSSPLPFLSPPTTPTPAPSQPTLSPPTTPTIPSASPPPTTPSSPSPPTPSSNPPPSPTPSPPTFSPSSSTPTPPKKGKCKNKNYPQCYNIEHACPSSCPGGCEVECASCKPVCKCDQPGAVCQDPRFIGGDGITFYFHGKKNHNFCLLSDSNLHINAHFIGKRNSNMKRDFTWVQSIAILFGKHQLYVGAPKTATWDDSVDRLALSFDGEPITLRESEGAKWQSESFPSVSFVRVGNTNNAMVEVQGIFRITAKVVPITEEDSRVHNYGVTKDDALAHLDLGFKFFSLSEQVDGVLGQTYRPDYVSRVKIGANMPVMGGDREFQTSGLFTADCAISRFNGASQGSTLEGLEFPSLNCASGMDGTGVVCKR